MKLFKNSFNWLGNGCPEGTEENSPAFQRWEVRPTRTSPVGTAERWNPARLIGIQPSLRDVNSGNRIPGVETPGYSREVPWGRSGDESTNIIRTQVRALFSSLPRALTALLLVSISLFTGCESTDGGSSSTTVYYGTAFYDPWYHGHYDYDYDVIVTPPDRPGSDPRPSHPIARPPASGGGVSPRPTPMPSIPSTPRVSPRGGGGRR